MTGWLISNLKTKKFVVDGRTLYVTVYDKMSPLGFFGSSQISFDADELLFEFCGFLISNDSMSSACSV